MCGRINSPIADARTTKYHEAEMVLIWKYLCSKIVGAYDEDSAGNLAYKKDWTIIDDSKAFSNVIRFIVFLITGKWVNFQRILLLQKMILSKATQPIGYENREI